MKRPARAPSSVSLIGAVVAVALLLAIALRVAGLGWGLPTTDRHYPYHPDEPLVAIAALRVDFASLQLSPRQFNYGSLSLYLDRLALDASAAPGRVDLDLQRPGALARLVGDTIRVGRWLTVLMGVLTVLAVILFGSRLYGARVGALAGLLLALAPLHLAHSHYSTVDVPAAWWSTLCLVLCAGALRVPGRAALAMAGACAGLAASTKYNAGLVLLAPLYTLVATWRRPEWYASDRAAALVYTPLAAAAAFLLTTPGVFLDSARFWHDFTYELRHTGTGHGLVFVQTAPAWLYHLTRSLPDGLGVPLFLAVIAGVLWALIRRRAEDGLLLSFILPYYLLIGSAEVKFSRYLLPILPALLLLAARVLFEEGAALADTAGTVEADAARVRSKPGLLHRLPSPVRLVIAALVVTVTAAFGIASAAVFLREDPRDAAAAWVRAQSPAGEPIALAGDPWFYTPPLAPSLGCTHALLPICGAPLPSGILAPAAGQGVLPPDALDEHRPRFILISEFEYADPLRLKAATGHTDGMTLLLDHLGAQYRLARTFRNRPSLGPFRWFQRRPPVHDLLYPMPDMRVYERKGT